VTRHAKASSTRLLGLLSVLGLLLVPASASAVDTHALSTTFGSAGHGDGQLELGEQSGVAVNQANHDVYVADSGNHRVVQFDPSKPANERFVRAFGADVGGPGVNVCTSGCVAATSGSSPGAFETPTFVAIDNSPGGEGDVYVADSANNKISKFKADGTLISGWGSGGQLSGPGVGEFFGELAGIAVDSAGTFDVFSTETQMFEFKADGTFVTRFFTARGTFPAGLAVDPAGNFFKVNGSPSVEKFGPTGADLGQVNLTETATGLAIDPADGTLYVDNGASIETLAFNGSGEVTRPGKPSCLPASFEGCPATVNFGGTDLTAAAGIAVDGSSHTVYAADAGAARVAVFVPAQLPIAVTKPATAIAKDSALMHGTVSADNAPATTCKFEYTTEASFKAEGFQGATSAPCTPAGPFSGGSSEAVSAQASGLASSTAYRFRLVATNGEGSVAGESLSFQTFGPPVVAAGSASLITTTSATINGSIDPEGEETTFQVQYVSEADFNESGYAEATSVPIVPAAVGSGVGFVDVTQGLTGLTAETAYRFRLVATNPSGTDLSPDGSFATFSVDTGLADGRAYEMVSPSLKIGEVYPPEPIEELGGSGACGLDFCQPGVDDQSLPVQAAADGNALAFEGQPFSEGLSPRGNQYVSRRSPDGWATRSVTPLVATNSLRAGSAALSPDLTKGVLFQRSPAFSPEAPVGEGGKPFSNFYLWEEGTPGQQPLVKTEPPNRSAGAGENTFELFFGGGNSGTSEEPAFGHLVFEANDALTPAVPGIAPAAPEAEAGQCGDNVVMGVSKSSCDIYEWTDGQLRLVNVLPGNNAAGSHAVIGSGRRLASSFSAELQTPNVDHAISADGSRIFWSDGSGQVYVRIDGQETIEIKDPGQFITATPDGSKVMLSDGCIYSLASESCEATLGHVPSAFVGILGASEDLSRVYFVDKEALAPGAQAESCEPNSSEELEGKIPPGQGCNLYVFDEGQVSFITALDSRDGGFGLLLHLGAWKADPSDRTAQVSADGRYLTFMSTVSRGGYDNRSANRCGGPSTAACSEVYQYDLDSAGLTCASCNPTGSRPLGRSNLSLVHSTPGASFPQLRNLPAEGEGEVFFESGDVLSPADHNGRVQDVYEWQPNGVGGCKRSRGCISLLSSGNSSSDSFFLSSTPSGEDAFFITRSQLLPKDKDDLFDVYDARVGGGINENTPPPCLGEACKGPATSAPEGQSAGSANFSGPGNEKPHKKKAHKHKKNSKKHKHKSKKKAHKRAAKSNRGGQK
jgi:hypothetical protein